jgi:hypothetical protein
MGYVKPGLENSSIFDERTCLSVIYVPEFINIIHFPVDYRIAFIFMQHFIA